MRSSSSLSVLRAFARSTAPRHIPTPTSRLLHTPRRCACAVVRPSIATARARITSFARFESSAASPTSPNAPDSRLERDQVPSYELTFTCNVCKTRSSHRLSKQGYHHGTVLIQCPDCKNRHLISDHLKVFSDKSVTIEDLMREKGNLVKKGSLSAEGDVEFWDDGSTTPRSAQFHVESTPKGDNRLAEQPTPSKPSQD
ncbi:DNL zinc finger domain containing protein [Pyrenophora tritici-repentis]|uniref:DNL zinc finger domain containing protein n=2 Tax=Pyrenophora tritici-repentis TaxID=45151 RepID=A0A2W1FAV4_9PLEO|nr:DNL zinc finger domain containing protein [Pyrenophora tritici-repentis Pt-1C-BFP]KAA8627095.1 Zf-DNL-domain-containing protein [Pyrenophora tritici-repentis]EDU44635.1 DNL zinc finger domain containing protein [Pyrenophora tritici-repentis Pt-1C-BFP]KAF7455527.1 Zf-DNL-domain-containing protein [Pyrenophora tritici-repentis]KAF7578731.1 DNL zinc finger domain containing protein [Pyrenophora tritici-repentis]KAG9389278.1 Zf-DNL-domain-containing protein [Pyrenophora tritici-repentis]